MKKGILGIVVLSALLFLGACSQDDGSVDLSDIKEIKVEDVTIKPVKAKVDDDDLLELDLEWSYGSNEDSSEQQSFMNTGILLFAEQDGTDLEQEIDSGTNLYNKVYETNEASIYPKFKLKNTEDEVKITVSKQGTIEFSKSFTVKLK